MRQKHNKGAEQENKNIKQKHTKNTTVRMLVKKEKICICECYRQ